MALVPIEGEFRFSRNSANDKVHVAQVTSAGVVDLGEVSFS